MRKTSTVDELADTEIIAQTDERIERDMQADAEETDDDIDKLDHRITEQNHSELADQRRVRRNSDDRTASKTDALQ